VFVNLLGSTRSRDVPDIWYQARKKIGDIRGTFPAGVVGPGFNDEFGDTYGILYAFTADGFTLRQLRDYVEGVRSKLLEIHDVSKIDIFGAQDEKVYVEFSPRRLAGLKLDREALIAALQAQNAVTPAGVVQGTDERILVQVTGRFRSEEDLRRVNFVVDGRIFRLSDIATVKRGYSDPPQPLFRFNGMPAIGLGIAMRSGGDVLALGRYVQAAMTKITANLPVGIEPRLVADQPRVVESAVNDFMEALWEAIAIVLGVSFLSLGLRAGCGRRLLHSARARSVFVAMEIAGIDLQRVSLGALIIALGLLVDDAMITVEMMVTKLEEGLDSASAATFAYTSTAFPMLTGTLVTVVGFMPIGVREECGRGIHVLDLHSRRHRPAGVVGSCGHLRAAARRRDLAGDHEAQSPHRDGSDQAPVPVPARQGDARALDHDRRYARLVGVVRAGAEVRSAAVLSRFGPAGAVGRPDPLAKCVDLRERPHGVPFEALLKGRFRCRPLDDVRRPGRGAILPAAGRAAPERLLLPDRHRDQESGCARARASTAREGTHQQLP